MKGRLAFARMIGSALASQALLSAANFAVGLLLIRHTSDLAYGYYILASTAILLIVSLQSAFVNPPLVNRLTPLDRVARRELVGGLYRDQRHVLRVCGGIAFVLCALLWEAGVFDGQTGPLILATIAATLASMHRGFFRLVLLAYRRAHDVLLTDICYIVILLLGVGIALFTPAPAVAAMIAIAFAAGISGAFTTGILRRHEPWDIRGAPGILREVAPLAAWSAAGAAIHWAFSQGYMYLAAGTLDVAAVAALAATRLLMMPVNLMSAGIGTLLLPLTAGWLREYSPAEAFRRLSLFSFALGGAALCYFGVLWFARDWIFDVVLHKTLAARDPLLLLWALAFLAMVLRDQMLYLLVACERFHQLTSLAFVSALISLLAGYVGMLQLGVTGAPLGVFCGEIVNLVGIVALSLRHIASLRHGDDGLTRPQAMGVSGKV